MHMTDNIKLVHQLENQKVVVVSQSQDNKSAILNDSKRCLIATISVFVIVSLIFLGTLLIYRQTYYATEEDIVVSPYTIDDYKESPKVHKIIDRLEWGGQPTSTKIKFLHHPVDLVIVAHTVTSFCSSFAECSKIVAAIQNYHLSLQLGDISYNFLIGGDGNVYVGRGWDVENSLRNQSIAISFIGNYLFCQLTEEMIDAVQMLLAQGVESGKLSEGYKIVGHNQTRATLSPGSNVYKVIKTWKHFSPERLRQKN